MRRAFLNPFTALAATAALFFALKSEMGYPATAWRALLFLFMFGYGCVGVYLAVFSTSAWYPVLKKLTFPEAYGNRVFMSGMGYSSMLPRTLAVCAIALFVFGADPAGVTRFAATLFAVATAAATFPIMVSPLAEAAP